MTPHEITPTVVPTPEDFPISWDNPEDQHLPLHQDKQHAPSPITPLSGWVAQHYWGPGSARGLANIDQPVAPSIRRVNTYYYLAITPSVSPDQAEEADRKAEASMQELVGTYADRWDNEWLPELRAHHDKWNAFDLPGATDQELIEHVDWTLNTFARLWDLHFQLMTPAFVAPSLLLDLYNDLIEDAGPLDAYKLIQGFDNASLRADADLWKLSRIAAESSEIMSILESTSTADVMDALENSEACKPLLDGIRLYAQEWGNRSDTIIEFADPSWVEDPTIVINILKGYLKDESGNPRDRWAEIVKEREELVSNTMDAIAGYPEPVKQQFKALLAAGQHGHRLQEDHNWWIDQQGTHQVRQVFLEVGNRMAASGAIPTRDDVFMLFGNEILDSASNGWAGEFASIVAERAAEMEHWSKVDAPLFVGTDYGPPPKNPVTDALGRFFDWGPPPEATGEEGTLTGNPGSAGKVVGTARVIIKLSDAHRLGTGDILVTATTAPPWTPLFATAGGVVTDTGGALSHCAIVAREYAIPAVVGAKGATRTIQDGDQIEVDGDAGTVRIL